MESLRAVCDVTVEMMKFKISFQDSISEKVAANDLVGKWLAERAARCLNPNQVGHDGKTASKMSINKDQVIISIAFAEQVLAKQVPKATYSQKKGALSPKCNTAIWFWLRHSTNERIVASYAGTVVKCRAALRRPKERY